MNPLRPSSHELGHQLRTERYDEVIVPEARPVRLNPMFTRVDCPDRRLVKLNAMFLHCRQRFYNCRGFTPSDHDPQIRRRKGVDARPVDQNDAMPVAQVPPQFARGHDPPDSASKNDYRFFHHPLVLVPANLLKCFKKIELLASEGGVLYISRRFPDKLLAQIPLHSTSLQRLRGDFPGACPTNRVRRMRQGSLRRIRS